MGCCCVEALANACTPCARAPPSLLAAFADEAASRRSPVGNAGCDGGGHGGERVPVVLPSSRISCALAMSPPAWSSAAWTTSAEKPMASRSSTVTTPNSLLTPPPQHRAVGRAVGNGSDPWPLGLEAFGNGSRAEGGRAPCDDEAAGGCVAPGRLSDAALGLTGGPCPTPCVSGASRTAHISAGGAPGARSLARGAGTPAASSLRGVR